MVKLLLAVALACGGALSCAAGWLKPAGPPFDWRLPGGFPLPIAGINVQTAEKFELGRRLFYDRRLSANGTQACSDCHQQRRAFSDGRSRAVGSTGQTHTLNAMTLTNVAYFSGEARYVGGRPMPPHLATNGVTSGRFRVPTLRNVALTGPYMHDGSIATLVEVIERYSISRSLKLSESERSELVAFLESLTDEQFVSDPRFGEPP